MNTKKHLGNILVATAISLSAQSALAGPLGDIFYISGGLSNTTLNANNNVLIYNYGIDSQANIENNDFGIELAGGLKIDQYLFFEAGYATLGSVRSELGPSREIIFNVHNLFIDAGLEYPVTDNISLITKAGVSFWEIYSSDDDLQENGVGLLYGAGLDFNLYGNKSRSLRVEWKHHEFDNTTLADADTITTSLIFRF